MITLKIIIFLVNISLILSCDSVTKNNKTESDGDWLIPESQVFDGGPGKDGIPALTSPSFSSVDNINYLSDNNLVIIVNFENEIKIYPHSILDWHEIINDNIGNTKFAVTYCPLTGSAIIWNRELNGEETTFGVSGLLYNSNLIPYDRKSNSNWSQMRLQSVNGSLISKQINTMPMIETTFATAKTSYPNAKVVTTNTGFSRNYGRYPYGDYRTNNSSFIFPVDNKDERLPSKERVLGVFDGKITKAYSTKIFSSEGEIIIDNIGTRKFLIYGNSQTSTITAFDISNDNNRQYNIVESDLPWIIKDSNGNKFDLFGNSDKKDVKLNSAKSFIAYWFGWAAFYPNTQLYNK